VLALQGVGREYGDVKALSLVALVSMAVVLGVSAKEPWRAFKSADGGKSFDGVLTEYSEKTEKVKVKLKDGKQAELALDKLSEEDVKWIKTTGVWQLRVAKLEVKLGRDKVSEEVIPDQESGELLTAEREGRSKRRHAARKRKGRTILVRKEGFKILILNPSKEDLEGLGCDYVFYALRKAADDKEIVEYKGSVPLERIEAGGKFRGSTRHVNLDKAERILGMVLHIKHAGEVVRTVETPPGIEALKNNVGLLKK
jgi:hypothetical protein